MSISFFSFIAKRTHIAICSCFFLISFITNAQNDSNTIDINIDRNDSFLGPLLEYFEEDGRSLTIEEIIPKNFTKSENEVLNFGYSTKAVWLKFRAKNTSDTTVKKIISIHKALQDSVQFFYKDKEKWKVLQSGQMISKKDKALPGFSISFPLELKEKTTSTFYIRMVSKWGKTFAVKLLDQHHYYKNEQKELVICSLLIGILLTIIVYNFFLSRNLKDPVYAVYCIAVFGALTVQLSFRGFVKLYLIDENPFLQEWSLSFLFCFATLCSSYFCIRFLDTKAYSKYADWALKSVVVLNVIAIFYPFISFEIFGIYTDARFFSYSAIQFCIVSIYSGIIVYYNGNKFARFLIFGWAVYFLGIILFSLAALDIIPANEFTVNAYLIGSVFEVFMLSSALADRYKQLKQQQGQLLEVVASKEQEITSQNNKISSLKLETLKFIKYKQQLTEELKTAYKAEDVATVKKVLINLQAESVDDKKLEILKRDIDSLNANQIAKLKEKYSNLTKGDLELASFLLLGLKRKEIALLRNTSFDAVKKAVHRFRKKIDISPEESIEDFILSLKSENK